MRLSFVMLNGKKRCFCCCCEINLKDMLTSVPLAQSNARSVSRGLTPWFNRQKLHLFVHGALSGLWPLLTSQTTLWEIMPFGLSSAFEWWNTVLVSVVKILSLLTAPHPVPTPKWAQALFGHQVCRAGLASEPGSLPCLGSLLLHTTHCDLLSGLHTVSLETAVPGMLPSWWKGVLIKHQVAPLADQEDRVTVLKVRPA